MIRLPSGVLLCANAGVEGRVLYQFWAFGVAYLIRMEHHEWALHGLITQEKFQSVDAVTVCSYGIHGVVLQIHCKHWDMVHPISTKL